MTASGDVTVVRDGNRGYMRDYLLTQISEADALKRIDEINAGQTTPAERGDADPGGRGDAPRRARKRRPRRAKRRRPRRAKRRRPRRARKPPKPAPEQMIFPAYGITVQQETTILLRDEPNGKIPTTGALKTINKPTRCASTAKKTGEGEQVWYQIENPEQRRHGLCRGV